MLSKKYQITTLTLFFVISLGIVGCGNAEKHDRPYDQRPDYPDHHYSPYYYRPYDPYYPRHYYRYHYYRRSCNNLNMKRMNIL